MLCMGCALSNFNVFWKGPFVSCVSDFVGGHATDWKKRLQSMAKSSRTNGLFGVVLCCVCRQLAVEVLFASKGLHPVTR